MYIKFLHKFFLPDVASASIAHLKLVSGVLSVTFTVDEGDEANKVQFAVTYSSGEPTATLKNYIVLQTILCIFYYINYIYYMY